MLLFNQTLYLSFSTCYATEADIPSCTPTVGQVTTSTGKKKREASHLVETHPKNTPVVTLDGIPIDFNEIIAPSRVNKIIFKQDWTKKLL